MATFENTIKRAVEWLADKPEGGDTEAVRAALGLTYMHVSAALGLAAKRDALRWIHEPRGKAHNRRVYFAVHHAPKTYGEASRKRQRGPGDHQKLKSLSRPVRGHLIGDAVIPAGVVPIVGPAFVGNRFEVADAPRVVDSSQCRPWAAAVGGYVRAKLPAAVR